MQVHQNEQTQHLDEEIVPMLIHTFLEYLGIEPNNPDHIERQAVTDCLYPALNHKLCEIIQEAKKIMRHSKRDYLKTQDIKFAMNKLKINEKIVGYPSNIPFNYIKISGQTQSNLQNASIQQQNLGNQGQKTGLILDQGLAPYRMEQSTIWYPKTDQIDLKDYLLNKSNPKTLTKKQNNLDYLPSNYDLEAGQFPLKLTYGLHFVAINGIQPMIPQNVQEVNKKVEIHETKEIAQTEQKQEEQPQEQVKEENYLEKVRKIFGSKLGKRKDQGLMTPSGPGVLTRELDLFYQGFIEKFLKLEEHARTAQLSNINLFTLNSVDGEPISISAFRKLLMSLAKEPTLVSLFPHILHFLQAKLLLSVQNAQPKDLQTNQDPFAFQQLLNLSDLILITIEALLKNQFYSVTSSFTSFLSTLLTIILYQPSLAHSEFQFELGEFISGYGVCKNREDLSENFQKMCQCKEQASQLLSKLVRSNILKQSEWRLQCVALLLKQLNKEDFQILEDYKEQQPGQEVEQWLLYGTMKALSSLLDQQSIIDIKQHRRLQKLFEENYKQIEESLNQCQGFEYLKNCSMVYFQEIKQRLAKQD